MFSHIAIGTNNPEAAKAFYDALLAPLGYSEGQVNGDRAMYAGQSGTLLVGKPINGEPATSGNGLTLGFSVGTSDAVDAAHAAGVANGGTTCEDPPGERTFGEMRLYLAYLRDPDGNKICLTCML
jgi:catechol 2,3-dioxygenase-like lactoylglutathione lyase family enzyme